jgi:hypothetical protein
MRQPRIETTPESEPQPALRRLLAGLRALVLIASAGYVVLFLVLVCLRVGYPFELEWLEGAMVDHVRTILAGEPLYAKPSLGFIPLTYTPAYFYLAAGLTKILGVGFLPLRLISIAASMGLFGVLFRLASRETGDVRAGVLAAGLFAAMFGWTDGWLDLARTDSLFLLLALLTIYILRWHTSIRATILAAVLISLAFLVKQTGLLVAIPLAVYCAWRGWRAFVSFAGTVAVIVIGSTVLLDRAFHGWYVYYVFKVPGQHPLAREVLWGFWRFDLLRPLPIALIGSALYLVWRLIRADRKADLDTGIFYLLASAGLFGGALASRLHSLSYINVVLPAYAALSLLFAIAVHDGVRAARGARLAPVTLYMFALLQLIRLAYAPASLVPTAEDVAAGRALVQRLADMPGNVFVPYHGYLPVLAGKPSHAHAVVIADVIRGGTTGAEKGLEQELDQALRTHQFDSIISVDAKTPVGEWLPIERYYRPAERVVNVRSRFWRPETRYVPR